MIKRYRDMRRKTIKNSQAVNRFINYLAAEKKKTILAVCLILLMIFMWLRVLSQTSPKAAEAELVAKLIEEQNQSDPEMDITFIELPNIEGRHDLIVRDFFASNGWVDFVNDQGKKSVDVEEIDIMSKDDDQEVIQKVAENLKLEAIVSSEDAMAFINDRVLRVGDKFFVSDGIESFECDVVEIIENVVVIKFRESRITLKLTQVN